MGVNMSQIRAYMLHLVGLQHMYTRRLHMGQLTSLGFWPNFSLNLLEKYFWLAKPT